MHDGPDPFGFHDGPNEKCNAADGNEDCFGREQMADLMHGKPDGRQAAKPKKKETEKVFGVRVGTRRKRIGKVLILGPDGADHERHALPSDPRLNPIPYACHCRSVEDRP